MYPIAGLHIATARVPLCCVFFYVGKWRTRLKHFVHEQALHKVTKRYHLKMANRVQFLVEFIIF
jgi:hypothetical protein